MLPQLLATLVSREAFNDGPLLRLYELEILVVDSFPEPYRDCERNGNITYANNVPQEQGASQVGNESDVYMIPRWYAKAALAGSDG